MKWTSFWPAPYGQSKLMGAETEITEELLRLSWEEILRRYPYAGDFFLAQGLKGLHHTGQPLLADIMGLNEDTLEDIGISKQELKEHFLEFLSRMEKLKRKQSSIITITILGGRRKDVTPETLNLTIRKGDVLAIVGPTGSGKSRLLADIECLAQKDTQTGRTVLIDGRPPVSAERFSIENKLIAQLSQNMNFVMDLPVMEFLKFHGESRMVNRIEETAGEIFDQANELAGEPFGENTPLTQLSGGQSRALMIADTAMLSSSPVVLIDEIENAGVDRKKALELLVREEKMVLMSTHDPLLALMGDRRLVIENGGVKAVIETSDRERSNLYELERIDRRMQELRNQIRTGSRVEYPVAGFFHLEG